jgi:hypothetical protein
MESLGGVQEGEKELDRQDHGLFLEDPCHEF